MSKKGKVIFSGAVVSVACAIMAITAYATMPYGSTTWNGNVGYGDVSVGTATKYYSGNTYLSYTGTPDTSAKVWLSTYVNNSLASVKTLLSYNTETSVITGAVVNQEVELRASREHLFDQVYALSGQFRP